MALLAVVLVLCFAGSYVVMVLLRRAQLLWGRRRLAWFAGLCLCFGVDVWVTHFIVMLAFNPGVPVYYDARRTVVSILASVLGGVPGFALLVWRAHWRFVWGLAGLLLAGAILLMHFIGMSAMAVCGDQDYKVVFVIAALIVGALFSSLSMRVMLHPAKKPPVLGGLLLAVGIIGLYFSVMGGLMLVRASGLSVIPVINLTDQNNLAIAIGGISLLLLFALLVSALADSKLAERQLEARRLWHLARHDDLTGLLNRRGLREKLEKLTVDSNGRPLLISIGLDRLKPVNDLFGRELVENLFCLAARRLSARLRQGDILAKPSGGEFVVLRAKAGRVETGMALAQELISCLSEPFVIDGVTAQIGASAGVVHGDGGGERAEALLTATDIALREAQSAGGGQVRLFTAEMSARLLRRHQLEQEFQGALRNRDFKIFYQPLFDCRSLELRGFEALARWQHPARGLIGPDEFIPVAEAGGMITALGEYVLEGACRAARNWPEDLRVAVNLSPLQLRDPALPDKVGSILTQLGLAPHRLELEVTEGAVLEQTAQVHASLAALKACGVGLAIDDFGAGYSSLSYLHRFSFERLKIDKSFIRAIAGSADARIVTGAIIGLGAALGMAVLAEGVETQAQLNILRSAGCGQVQGFLLGRPMPEADIQPLLEKIKRTGNVTVPA